MAERAEHAETAGITAAAVAQNQLQQAYSRVEESERSGAVAALAAALSIQQVLARANASELAGNQAAQTSQEDFERMQVSNRVEVAHTATIRVAGLSP